MGGTCICSPVHEQKGSKILSSSSKKLLCKQLIPAAGWKVLIREVENTLFFFNVVTLLCSIDADN